MVKEALEEENEKFYECHDEEETWAPSGVSIVAVHLQDENDSDSDNGETLHHKAFEDTFAKQMQL